MKKWQETSIAVAFGIFLTSAIEGIIGNRADNGFILLTDIVSRSLNVNTWPWIITGVVLALSLVELFYFWQHDKVKLQANKRITRMIELDGSLLKLLANWVPDSDPVIRANGKKRLLSDVIRNAIAEFNESPTRGAILLPDISGEYLRCVASAQMPQETVDEMVFYIGDDEKRRDREGGIAGYVYHHSDKLLVTHMKQLDGGQWICKDFAKYVRLKELDSSMPAYKSLVSVPIFGPDPSLRNKTKCIGILCFDSMNEDVFDLEEIKVLLLTLASRVASAILIEEKL